MIQDKKDQSEDSFGAGIGDERDRSVPTHTFDFDSVVAEVEELQRRGLLNDASANRIQEKALKDFQQVHEQGVASINAQYAPKSNLLPWKYRAPILFVFLFVLGSILLHITVGEGFVFVHANEYRSALPWLTLAFALPLGGLVLGNDKLSETLFMKFPTPWIRWLLVFPVSIGLYSLAIAAAPLGWIALYGWTFGKKVDSMGATVAYIEPYSHRRGCNQSSILEIAGKSAQICLDHRLFGEVPKVGEVVLVRGKVSPMGLYISEVRRVEEGAQ